MSEATTNNGVIITGGATVNSGSMAVGHQARVVQGVVSFKDPARPEPYEIPADRVGALMVTLERLRGELAEHAEHAEHAEAVRDVDDIIAQLNENQPDASALRQSLTRLGAAAEHVAAVAAAVAAVQQAFPGLF